MPHCNAIYLRVFLFQFKTAKLQLHRRKSKLNRPKAAKAAETRKTVESSGKCKITTFFGRTRILEIFIKRRKHKRQTGMSGIRVGKCCLFVEAMTACVVSLSHDVSCSRKHIQVRIRGRPTNVVNNSYKQKKVATEIATYCGKTGIRTLGTDSRTTVFETAPIVHSGIFPEKTVQNYTFFYNYQPQLPKKIRTRCLTKVKSANEFRISARL